MRARAISLQLTDGMGTQTVLPRCRADDWVYRRGEMLPSYLELARICSVYAWAGTGVTVGRQLPVTRHDET